MFGDLSGLDPSVGPEARARLQEFADQFETMKMERTALDGGRQDVQRDLLQLQESGSLDPEEVNSLAGVLARLSTMLDAERAFSVRAFELALSMQLEVFRAYSE
jgi:hypothetical protein